MELETGISTDAAFLWIFPKLYVANLQSYLQYCISSFAGLIFCKGQSPLELSTASFQMARDEKLIKVCAGFISVPLRCLHPVAINPLMSGFIVFKIRIVIHTLPKDRHLLVRKSAFNLHINSVLGFMLFLLFTLKNMNVLKF